MTKISKVIISVSTAIVCLGPFLFIGLMSLASSWRYPEPWPAFLSMKHWVQFGRTDHPTLNSLGLSLAVSLPVSVLSTLLGFVSSRPLAFHRKKERLLGWALFPYTLSPVIYAACLLYYFARLGLSGSFVGVMLAQLLICYPYAAILCTGFWNDQSKALGELVATLGGSLYDRYVHAYFPLFKGLLGICFFQTFLISWFEYGLTSLLGVGKVQTLTILVFQYIQEANIHFAALAACLLCFPPLILLAINRRVAATFIS